ncbi:MAG: helix-turn-helix transcriptional regulator [Phycisphaerales bacterium]|nr:helix-turn-helix transcriptional regulator [Phycisphaerales bacterium]
MSILHSISAVDDSITQSTDHEHLSNKDTGPGSFHERLNSAVGEVSYRKLGRLTDTHPETVRRYMQGQAPSATFLTNLCRVLGISGEWMLTGRGPMKCTEMKSHALSQADPSELMTAIANTLTNLCDRMDRLERFVQSMETRIRGTEPETPRRPDKPKATKLTTKSGKIAQDTNPIKSDHDTTTQQSNRRVESKPEQSAADEPSDVGKSSKSNSTAAQRIRDAIAKRPS